jgi:hypothetical protein
MLNRLATAQSQLASKDPNKHHSLHIQGQHVSLPHKFRHPIINGDLPQYCLVVLSNSLFIRHLRKRSLREASPLQPFSR